MMKLNKSSLGLLLSVVIVLAGCTGQQAPVETAEQNKPVPVQVDTVKKGSVATRTGVTGKLAPNQEVALTPKVSGKIVQLNVALGQQVQKGQVLFSLDKNDLMNSVRQAEAQYQVALANLKQSDANAAQSLQQAKNGLTQAEQGLKDAQRNEQRMAELFNQGAISAQQYEQAKTALTNAQTAYENAKQALATAQQRTGVAVMEASVEQARVALQNAREQLANTTVTSPISGYVAAVNGAVGEMASPQQPVVTVVNTNPLIVKANLSEAEISSVKQGEKVTVSLPALNKDLVGTVKAVSPVMDPTLRAYPVEISLSNPDNQLKADMVVNVKFGQEQTSSALIVPRKAVFDENGKRFVYKLEGTIAKKVEVTTGEESSDLIEVKTGLADGDKIVVKGQTLLTDGATVEIQEGD
jgi:HlyD family secretion protein